MNGGRDVKIGDDKRQVSIIPSNEVPLYNYDNSQILTDEFGTPVITEVDTFFLTDASKDKSTSIVFSSKTGNYTKLGISTVGIKTATYPFGGTNRIGINTTSIRVGDIVVGSSVPDATIVSRIGIGSIFISNKSINSGLTTETVVIKRNTITPAQSNPVWKIEEQFKETSEVSTTLLGINREERQLSLFSNVSSYGLDKDDFEYYLYDEGISVQSWDNRKNAIFGNRYVAKLTEETQESGIRITSFPVPYSFPFGPLWEKVGLYNSNLFNRYKNFIILGNDLYTYYDTGAGSGYPSGWKEKFLAPTFAQVSGNDVNYVAGITTAFAQIDTWTETWKDINDSKLSDPVTGETFGQTKINQILGTTGDTLGNTLPGYRNTDEKFIILQSRKVFRYQPGRISGFTFGLRSSKEAINGVELEWGISNPTDQYVFRVEAGQFYIVRRSTKPLSAAALARNGLTLTDQGEPIPSGNRYDTTEYYTIKIPKDNFNGDSLDTNGPSGYNLLLDNVTMYKIEFGWYGAIGARFYAYIPVENGEARWVVIHTLVIEDQLDTPCLEDSYFRFKYSLRITNTRDVRYPQYVYKYGASYYIDGGDDGTSQVYSASTNQKTIYSSKTQSLLAINPKDYILNSTGSKIQNKKQIFPTQLNVTSDSLAELKIVTCSACPGFGHAYTPGLATTESGRYVDIQFDTNNTIEALGNVFKLAVTTTGDIGISTDLITGIDTSGITIGHEVIGLSTIVSVGTTVISIGTGTVGIGTTTLNTTIQTGVGFTFGSYEDSYFYESDIGAKLIAPSIYNAYITDVTDPVGDGSYQKAVIKGRNGTGYDLVNRSIPTSLVFDRVTGLTTSISLNTPYPHPVRLSNYSAIAASDFQLTGSKIEIQFVNPVSNRETYTQFAEFLIGLTNKKPKVSGVNNLEGFYISGTSGVSTTILPKSAMVYADHLPTNETYTPEGVERSEGWYPVFPNWRMEIDERIPSLANPAGGICSKATVNVLPSQSIDNVRELNYLPGPNANPNIPDPQGRRWLEVTGTFPAVDYDEGQVVLSGNPPTLTNAKFVGLTSSYVKSVNNVPTTFSFIQISQTTSASNLSNFSIAIRPVQITATGGVSVSKIFNYNPYPLYLVAQLRDNAKINNISIKETVGDYQRTISPKWYIYNNTSVDTVGGKADTDGAPPPNFTPISRLSSALVDTQNQQELRPYIIKDTIYVGQNSSKSVDLKKIFGPDRTSITPDNNNIEATFLIAKKIDAGSEGTIQTSLNFKEQ